jgi:putative NADH-flavin reductase
VTELKMKTKVIHEVDVFDLEAFVKEVYGINVEIVAMQEASNDSSLSFSVESAIEDYFLDTLDEIMSTGYSCFGTGTLLNKLCLDGHIPAGEYLVKISW